MVEIVVLFTEHEQLITQLTVQRVADVTLALYLQLSTHRLGSVGEILKIEGVISRWYSQCRSIENRV